MLPLNIVATLEHSKKLSREKTFTRFGRNKIFTEKTFVEKTFTDCSLVSLPKDAIPPNFAEKTFTNSCKTSKFAKVFSLGSFPLYGSSYTKLNNIIHSIWLRKYGLTLLSGIYIFYRQTLSRAYWPQMAHVPTLFSPTTVAPWSGQGVPRLASVLTTTCSKTTLWVEQQVAIALPVRTTPTQFGIILSISLEVYLLLFQSPAQPLLQVIHGPISSFSLSAYSILIG